MLLMVRQERERLVHQIRNPVACSDGCGTSARHLQNVEAVKTLTRNAHESKIHDAYRQVGGLLDDPIHLRKYRESAETLSDSREQTVG